MQRREQQRTLSKASSSGRTDEAANVRTRQQSTSTRGCMMTSDRLSDRLNNISDDRSNDRLSKRSSDRSSDRTID